MVNSKQYSGSAISEQGSQAYGSSKEVIGVPIVRVEMWPGRTRSQKAELARVITEAVVTIAHATAESTIVVFEDVPRENWSVGGVLASEAQA